MFHAFAVGSRSQLALFCFPLWVFGTSNTMPLLGWIRVFTGRLSNLGPRIFLTVSWVNVRPVWMCVEGSGRQSAASSGFVISVIYSYLCNANKGSSFASLCVT